MTREGMTPEEFLRAVAPVSEPSNSAGIERGGWRLVVGITPCPPPPTPASFQAYPPLFYPNASSASSATPIDLEGGDDRQNVDFELQPVSTVRISGRVTGPADATAGLVLRLLPEGSENLGQGEVATGRWLPTAVSRSSPCPPDITRFGRSPPSASSMRGRIDDGSPGDAGHGQRGEWLLGGSSDGILRSYRVMTGNESFFARLQLDVVSDEVANVVVALHRSATISGRFEYDGVGRPKMSPRASIDPADGSPACWRFVPLREVRPTCCPTRS